ncbi:MAG: hypothetical protein R3F56_11760 [Planctomycetota bacterium]
MRRSALVLPVLALTAHGCKGGGNRTNDTTPPVLLAAAVLGSGPNPSPGETLRLTFDEAVALVAGRLLTDADLALSPGSSLGDVVAAPSQVDARTIDVVLGTGVALAPGTSTLALASGNDVVADTAGNLGVAGTGVVLTQGDGDAPVISSFTASEVDTLLNGTGPAGGTLQVPTTGFTIDLAYSDATSNVAPAANFVAADVAVTVSGQSVAAGSNLVPHLQTLNATSVLASYRVPPTLSFPAADVTLTATIDDSSGMRSAPRMFALRTVTANDALRPFETTSNASQVWYLDTTRDLESYALQPLGGTAYSVQTTLGANGRPDLYDALSLVGVLGPDNQVNANVLNLMQIAVVLELATLLGGANVSFTFSPPGTFGAQSSVPYNSFGFSQICIAGAPSQAGVLGLALYDANNDTQNDDCLTNIQGSRLGVFVLTVMDNVNGLAGPSTTTFRQTYDPLRSEVGGQAVGANAQDAGRLAGSVNDSRQTVILNAIGRMARFIAVVVAHETGHSMGLVKNGPMPTGLYGGDAANFPGSSDTHIRMPTALFPLGSINVMSPTLNFELALSSRTAFNSLNRAYLRERALYNR